MPARRLEAIHKLFASLLLVLAATAAAAADLQVLALFKDRAVLRAAGAEHLLRVGETSPDGITLLAADARSARVRYRDREQVLTLSARVAGSYATPAPARVAIAPDAQGQYRVRGFINGQPADFLVDTGASLVVMNGSRARSLGLAFEQGQPGSIQTAQGRVSAFFLPVESVVVAGIESRSVAAAVIDGEYPADILLGMSFLRDVSIEARDGVMTLIRKH